MEYEKINTLTEQDVLKEYENIIESGEIFNISGYWCCYCASGNYGYRCGYAVYGQSQDTVNRCYEHYMEYEARDICNGRGYCCLKAAN